MLVDLFSWLSGTLQSSPHVALAGSFLWGVLSVALSPCHLSSIPLIVGFVSGRPDTNTSRAFMLSGLFSLGILITITVIGVITSLAGRMLGDLGPAGNYMAAALLFAVGLNLSGILPLPFLGGSGQPDFKGKGFSAAFILGLLFGTALGPCTFAYMAPMLGVALAFAATSLLFSVSMVAAYALGHCSVIVFAGTFAGGIQRFLNWNESSGGITIIKRVCGVLLMIGGIYILYLIRRT